MRVCVYVYNTYSATPAMAVSRPARQLCPGRGGERQTDRRPGCQQARYQRTDQTGRRVTVSEWVESGQWGAGGEGKGAVVRSWGRVVGNSLNSIFSISRSRYWSGLISLIKRFCETMLHKVLELLYILLSSFINSWDIIQGNILLFRLICAYAHSR